MPNSSLDRFADQMSGYKYITNVSDFIGYKYPHIFYLEIKTIIGNTFPLSNLSQYDKLLMKKGIRGVRAGVVIWFQTLDKVLYVPIVTIERMKLEGKKSVNGKTINHNDYYYIDIPGEKKRVFLDCNYSVMQSILDDDEIEDRFYGGKR